MGDPPSSQKKGDVERLLAAARRQMRLVIFTCILSVVLGIGYIATAVPQYTATAVLLLDNRRVRAVQDVYDVAPLGMDMIASAVDSQVEVLKSDSVMQTVIDRLQLLKDPEFAKPVPGLDSLIIAEIWKLMGLATSGAEPRPPVDSEVARRRAADELRNNVQSRRVPRTLVVEIMYRSPDPE